MRTRVVGLLLVALCVVTVVPLVASAPAKPFDQLAPENATLYVGVRNVSSYLGKFEASAIGEAWNSPEMKPFVTKLTEAFDVLFAEAGKEMGYRLQDYKGILQGEMALVLGDPAAMDLKAKRIEIPLAILLDVGNQKEKAREFLKKNLALTDKQGKSKQREETFRGHTLYLIENKTPDEKDLKALVITLADDLLAVSLSQPFLQDMLANRADAAVRPLSEHADYRMVRGKFGKDADVFAYAHIGRWLDNLPRLAKAAGGEEAETNLPIVNMVLDMIGLSTVRSVALSGSIAGDGVSQTIFIQTAGTPKGLLKALSCPPQPLRFPAIVPDDVHSCSILLVNFEAIWEMVEGGIKMAQQMMGGGGAGGVDPLKVFEEQLGISIKRDLIGSLGKQIVLYERLKKPYSMQSQAQAFLFELKDKAKFQATFEKLLAMVPFLQKKEYLGRALYTMGMPGMEEGADPAAPTPPMPAVCVTDTHFVIATAKDLAEEAIRRIGKEVRSVTDTPGFKAVEGKLPPSAMALSYQSPEGFEFLFFMAKQIAKGGIPGMPPGLDVMGELEKGMDATGAKFLKQLREAFEKLPEASVFTKRMVGGIGWGFVDEKGIGVSSKFIFKTTTRSER
jgi:hypothetical protein